LKGVERGGVERVEDQFAHGRYMAVW
jgi:hypothetical protein